MTLFHYTTPAGLAGILTEKAFWASDYRFLNDTSEFQYGKAILKKSIQMYQSDIETASVEAWHLVSSRLDNIDSSRTVAFVASFTTEGDLLSQWRGYNAGQGFAIGINGDWLNQNAIAQGFALAPVVYDKETQERLAMAAANLLVTMLQDANYDPTRISNTVSKWWKHALKVALIFKDKHFSEEREQRLVYIGESWPSAGKQRYSPSGIIPYLPCKFDQVKITSPIFAPQNLGLEKIIIGPAMKPNQRVAVDALLASHHMRFSVVDSDIPYTAN